MTGVTIRVTRGDGGVWLATVFDESGGDVKAISHRDLWRLFQEVTEYVAQLEIRAATTRPPGAL